MRESLARLHVVCSDLEICMHVGFDRLPDTLYQKLKLRRIVELLRPIVMVDK